MSKVRKEQEVFDNLSELCSTPGYLHAFAAIAFRDNMVRYSDELRPDDLEHMFSHERLNRTEQSTLLGLLIKRPIDLTSLDEATVEKLVRSTDELMLELHRTMDTVPDDFERLLENAESGASFLSSGAMLKEAIFYAGDGAYASQYLAFSESKYQLDDNWLATNRGFKIKEAAAVIRAVCRIQTWKVTNTVQSLRKSGEPLSRILPGYTFTPEEVADEAHVEEAVTIAVLNAFSVSPKEGTNEAFKVLGDFNIASAAPIIRLDANIFAVFSQYTLCEALYESPFYWMIVDKLYKDEAAEHRGEYTESLAASRLSAVFGKAKTYKNINLIDAANETVGEIDVLVHFGDRAIILQAKSKRLTLEARRGNDGQIKKDFGEAVADAYEQAYRCAGLLMTNGVRAQTKDGLQIDIPNSYKEIFPVCIVADHYPSLAFQVDQFLSIQTTEQIKHPLVLDVFTLDVMAEMLESPLRFLSYLSRRAEFGGKFKAGHEMTVLAFHLKHNLWLGGEYDLAMLEDDFCMELDVCMSVRRDGIAGPRTPDGILTRLTHSELGVMLSQIEQSGDSPLIEFGLHLLKMSEKSTRQISRAIHKLGADAVADGRSHDFSVPDADGNSGLTVHCNTRPQSEAAIRLAGHCALRKYRQKASSWFGILFSPLSGKIVAGANLEFPWEFDETLEIASADLTQNMQKLDDLFPESA